MPSQSPVRAPAHVLSLLDRLHTLSETQEPAFNTRFRELAALRASDPDAANHELDLLALDKFVALDRDKCEFVYQLILATGAKTVVEAGTSFGVSTMYLALAVGENSRNGKVIATEKEPDKAAKARTYWAEAGECVQRCIELREGDLLETLTRDLTEVDMLLLDIWTPLALPTLKIVQKQMRSGAVIVADNTISSAAGYRELFEYIHESEEFRTLTVPYSNGLEMIVYKPSSS